MLCFRMGAIDGGVLGQSVIIQKDALSWQVVDRKIVFSFLGKDTTINEADWPCVVYLETKTMSVKKVNTTNFNYVDRWLNPYFKNGDIEILAIILEDPWAHLPVFLEHPNLVSNCTSDKQNRIMPISGIISGFAELFKILKPKVYLTNSHKSFSLADTTIIPSGLPHQLRVDFSTVAGMYNALFELDQKILQFVPELCVPNILSPTQDYSTSGNYTLILEAPGAEQFSMIDGQFNSGVASYNIIVGEG